MTTTVNWAKLVSEGRCKAMGIPWTKEEQEALKNGMSADDVRNGYLSPEDKLADAKLPEGERKPLKKMTKVELVKVAKELKINFDADVATKGDLILEIEKVEEKNAKDEAKKAEDAKNKAPEAKNEPENGENAKDKANEAEGEKNA